MAALLRRVGFRVRSIYEVYPNKKHEKTPDPTWIAKCGKEGWVAVTGDKRIETNPINRHAVIEAKCKVFILTDSNSRPEEFGAAIIVGCDKIQALINKDGPFFVNIGKQAQSHIRTFRVPTPEGTVPVRKSRKAKAKAEPAASGPTNGQLRLFEQ